MSRILIVEDDRKIAQLESDYLESNGYETKIIEDGKKALHAYSLDIPSASEFFMYSVPFSFSIFSARIAINGTIITATQIAEHKRLLPRPN